MLCCTEKQNIQCLDLIMKIQLRKREKKILDYVFYPWKYRISEGEKIKKITAFLKPSSKVGLDLGCGSGWLTAALAKKGFKMTAVDISDAALDSARFLFKKEKLKIPLLKASALKLPLPDKSFDFINLCEVLEHIPHPEKAIEEIRRCLKDEGKLCLSVPNSWTFGLVYDRFLLRIFTDSSERGGGTNPTFGLGKETIEVMKKIGFSSSIDGFGHINQFSVFSIKKLLQKSSFKIVEVESLEFLTPYFLTFFSGLLKIDKGKLKSLQKIDQKLTRLVPNFLGANWLILAKKCHRK